MPIQLPAASGPVIPPTGQVIGDTYTLHPYWMPHWSNEVEFAPEK